MEFTAVKTFHCPELKSDYAEGMSYTARDPDGPDVAAMAKSDPKRAALLRKNRAILRQLLPAWLKEGKVIQGRIGPMSAGVMGGSGTVN